MAKVDLHPGVLNTDVIVTLSDSEAKAVVGAGAGGAIAALDIPPPFGEVVAGVIAAAASDIKGKNRGNGVRIVVTVVTATLSVIGWNVDSL